MCTFLFWRFPSTTTIWAFLNKNISRHAIINVLWVYQRKSINRLESWVCANTTPECKQELDCVESTSATMSISSDFSVIDWPNRFEFVSVNICVRAARTKTKSFDHIATFCHWLVWAYRKRNGIEIVNKTNEEEWFASMYGESLLLFIVSNNKLLSWRRCAIDQMVETIFSSSRKYLFVVCIRINTTRVLNNSNQCIQNTLSASILSVHPFRDVNLEFIFPFSKSNHLHSKQFKVHTVSEDIDYRGETSRKRAVVIRMRTKANCDFGGHCPLSGILTACNNSERQILDFIYRSI